MKNISSTLIFLLFIIVITMSCTKAKNNYDNYSIKLLPFGYLNSICEMDEYQKNDSK